MLLAKLKPATAKTAPCKICGAPAAFFGSVDFHRSCEEARGKFLPPAGIAIDYRRCAACGFLFSESLDHWTEGEFQKHIYNEDYINVDPDYGAARPLASAQWMATNFPADKSRLRVLDYGGGNGALSAKLRELGFGGAETYDPFTPEFARLPGGQFDIVTCFETLEHHPKPMSAISAIAKRTANPGIAIFTTQIQPLDFAQQGMGWWYIGPRNGHISLFSAQSLELAWRRVGYKLTSFTENLHIAWRRVPDFARHFLDAP